MKNIEVVKWWEKKRKIFNIFLILFISLTALFNPSLKSFLSEFIIWILLVNLFYCLGAGFELSLKHYKIEFTNYMRWLVFVLGTLISFLTIFSFHL